MDEAALNWKQHSKKWSIAQNIEHVILINESFFSTFDSLAKGTYEFPFLSRFEGYVNFMSKLVLQYVSADRKKKMKTFSLWEPSQGVIEGDIVMKFTAHQTMFKQKMNNCSHLLGKRTLIASPASKLIVYSLDTALEGLLNHEERHYLQALDVLNSLNSIA